MSSIEVKMKMSSEKARDVECLLKTCDRLGLMPPYLVMAETTPSISWVGPEGCGFIDHKHIVTVRIVGEKIFTIEIDRDDV